MTKTAQLTVADIDSQSAQLEADLEAADAELARLQGERRAVILKGDDAAADKHDDKIAQAERTVERLTVRLGALAERRDEAEKAERTAALNRRLAELEARIEQDVADLETVYRPLAEQLAAFVGRWAETEKLVHQLNKELRGSDHPTPFVRGPELRARTRDTRVKRTEHQERQQWIRKDPVGGETPVTFFRTDPETGEQIPDEPNAHLKRWVEKVEVERGEMKRLPPLAETIRIPGATPDDPENFWRDRN